MQMHPMVTVKKAAALLGIDKSVLRQRLSEGSLKGERRLVGSKEKWFIYCGELDILLDQRLPELIERAERTSIDGLSDFFTNGEIVPIGEEISKTSDASQDETRLDSTEAVVPVESNLDRTEAVVPVESNPDRTEAVVPVESNPDRTEAAVPVESSLDSTEAAVPVKSKPDRRSAAAKSKLDRRDDVACESELDGEAKAFSSNLQNLDAANAIDAEFQNVEAADSSAVPSPKNETASQTGSEQSLDFSPSVPAKMITEGSFPDELFKVEGVLESQSAADEVPGLEGIVRCLTIEFAYRLTEERQTICKLQDQLEEKEMLLRRVPLLEKSLHEVATCDRDKELELANLRAHVTILEKQVERLKEPWWHRLNRWVTGT